MSTELTRRSLLKGITLGAGATLLSPILAQLAAHAAGDEQHALRKRVVFVVQSNGLNPNHLVPVGVKRRPDGRNERPTNDKLEELTLHDKELHSALEPLTPFKDRMAFVQGLSGRIAISDHSANHGALGAYGANRGAMMQTIDSAIGEALPGTFSHVAVGLNGGEGPMNYRVSAAGPGKEVPIICSPDLAFASLFGSVAEGSGKAAFDRRTNLLDFMADDVRRSRAELVGDERQKFDRYLEAFETLHNRQRELVAKTEELKKVVPKLGEKATTSVSSLILEAQFEIAGAALVAGLTNVVTLASGGGGQQFGKFPEFNIPDLHGIGHGNAYGRESSEDCFVELRRFHTRLIAGLVAKLQNTPEGSGTMLDNTLLVYLSDSGEGHHPSLYEWPVVLIGNLGGKLKTDGRYLQFPNYGTPNHRTMANLYCTLLHAVGKPRDKFGVPDPGLRDVDQTGVISELLA
ncbi:protein of unknown function DUF1552 [Pirellula staleyi DSM 6068]|uniref:DUF1552 domain-containing protein n=1 Tax=Pirellula staleyi (strain ATCC 27377 / DSM 6068 / ICPB 4128) TaxID=530564 RepID=D2R287_PIRSD|nr:DUF1552 domain-containing protein [Pirellula staleyi]ADB14996.1 protein of unknown function DUF1552 [Pirellula staleyi DSM 6068]